MATQEEKIDYIYERLKKQEKQQKIAFILKWVFRVFIILYLYFFLTSMLPKLVWGMVPWLWWLPFNIWGESNPEEINLSEDNIEQLKWVLDTYFNDQAY